MGVKGSGVTSGVACKSPTHPDGESQTMPPLQKCVYELFMYVLDENQMVGRFGIRIIRHLIL